MVPDMGRRRKRAPHCRPLALRDRARLRRPLPLAAPIPTPDQAWPVRPDPFSSYRSGFEVRTYRRCRRVLMFHHFPTEANVGDDCLVRSHRSALLRRQTPSRSRQPDLHLSGSRHPDRLPPRRARRLHQPIDAAAGVRLQQAGDPAATCSTLDARTASRTCRRESTGRATNGSISTARGSPAFSPTSAAAGVQAQPQPAQHRHATRRQRVHPAELGPLEHVAAPRPATASATDRSCWTSPATAGSTSSCSTTAMPGFFERTTRRGLGRPSGTSQSLPRIDWSEPEPPLRRPHRRRAGRRTPHRRRRLHVATPRSARRASASRSRVATGERGARPRRRLRRRHPDGLSRRHVRRRAHATSSGSATARSATGPTSATAASARKVTMDDAPRFDRRGALRPAPRPPDRHRRLRHHRPALHRRGRRPRPLQPLGQLLGERRDGSPSSPPPTRSASVQVVDLLGNGTACLVWSSPLPGARARAAALRRPDGRTKPHLLIRSRNNLGAETRVRYAPSTRFYLADQAAGKPWITRLPFPVQVVERMETYDCIGRSRFVTRYAYHHGYFDGEEREFRGFGMVEQWDTEEHRDDTLTSRRREPTNWSDVSWLPPDAHADLVPHRGLHRGGERLAAIRAASTGPSLRPRRCPRTVAAREALLLPDTIMPTGLVADAAEEMREAYRAMKGSTLRIEVYAEDGTARAEHPYTVTEQNFTVRRHPAPGEEQTRGVSGAPAGGAKLQLRAAAGGSAADARDHAGGRRLRQPAAVRLDRLRPAAGLCGARADARRRFRPCWRTTRHALHVGAPERLHHPVNRPGTRRSSTPTVRRSPARRSPPS